MPPLGAEKLTKISQQHINTLERRANRVEALTAFMLNHHELTGEVDGVLFEMLAEETQHLSSSVGQIPSPAYLEDIPF